MPGRLIPRTWSSDPTIDAPPKYRRACRYEAFLPDALASLSLDLGAHVAGLISDAEHSIRDLNERASPALIPMARLLLRTESIASSKIEGLQLGVRELTRAEARLETGGNASPTAIEVLSNIDAMILAVEDAAQTPRFGIDEIIAIHRRLVERAPYRHIAGQLRTQQNWIGGNDYNPCGADFVPPPPENVPELLADLCDAINDERLPPLVQAALVHAQFETIHPFGDGNGRTGRALIHVVLRRRRLAPRYLPPISVALATAKDRYIDGLTNFRGSAVQTWLEYFAAATSRSAKLAQTYLAEVDNLLIRWREQLGASSNTPRAGAAAWEIIDALPAYPAITAVVAAAATERSKPQTYQAIEQLVDAGVLIPLSISRRNRAWEPAGLVELIEGFEAGRWPR